MKGKYIRPKITTKKIKLNIFLGSKRGSLNGGSMASPLAAFAYCDTSVCGCGTSACWSPCDTPICYPA